MFTPEILIVAAAIFLIAVLYSMVGHGGASGYLAVMALAGILPEIMRPSALALNIIVASIAAVYFLRMGYFSFSLFWPFALASVPFAFIGGTIALPSVYYMTLVGFILLLASARTFYFGFFESQHYATRLPPNIIILMLTGALLGLVSGLTGVGGGIFLSPLLLFFRWAEPRVISGIAALFILLNSIAGLTGVYSAATELPLNIFPWAVAALLGGLAGGYLGSIKLNRKKIMIVLGAVLMIAGLKMIF